MNTNRKAYGLVRGKDGRPVVDDPKSLPPQLVAMLTDAEKRELGIGADNGNADDRSS